ncbi:MarR family winged helix-turn-helix transcriptional regulator [Streptomyces sp. NBC_00448]|uniref:MarR family winged helix-turn-helix transcriptional regulator n=1 Tax=Streptomyces sp. NBC_00448 TaxID=2903652 RepID=UPI002E1D4659
MADQRSGADQAGADRVLEEFIQAAEELFYAMRRSRAAISGQSDQGLSLSQPAMLTPLADDEELPVGTLAGAADVSVPTATRMLQQLQNKGIVTRRRSPTDERRVLIGLTPEGREQVAAVRTRLRERRSSALDHYTRTELVGHLRRLADTINKTGTS